MFGSIGITELVLILVIVMIIFGAGKLPQLGEGLGKAIKGFKKSVHEADAIEAEAETQAQAQMTTQVQTQQTPPPQPEAAPPPAPGPTIEQPVATAPPASNA